MGVIHVFQIVRVVPNVSVIMMVINMFYGRVLYYTVETLSGGICRSNIGHNSNDNSNNVCLNL